MGKDDWMDRDSPELNDNSLGKNMANIGSDVTNRNSSELNL
jgi:hypothetical protein